MLKDISKNAKQKLKELNYLANGIICDNCSYIGRAAVVFRSMGVYSVDYFFCRDHICNEPKKPHIDTLFKKDCRHKEPTIVLGWVGDYHGFDGRVCSAKYIIKDVRRGTNYWNSTMKSSHVYGALLDEKELFNKIVSLVELPKCPCKC